MKKKNEIVKLTVTVEFKVRHIILYMQYLQCFVSDKFVYNILTPLKIENKLQRIYTANCFLYFYSPALLAQFRCFNAF